MPPTRQARLTVMTYRLPPWPDTPSPRRLALPAAGPLASIPPVVPMMRAHRCSSLQTRLGLPLRSLGREPYRKYQSCEPDHGCRKDRDGGLRPGAYTLRPRSVLGGGGSVGLIPPGGTYDSGTSVQLTATPASGYRFDHWEDDLSGSTNPASITMNGNKNVTAVFAALAQHTLTVAKAGSAPEPGPSGANRPGSTAAGPARTATMKGRW